MHVHLLLHSHEKREVCILKTTYLFHAARDLLLGTLAGYDSRTKIPFLYPLYAQRHSTELPTNVNQVRARRPVSWRPPKPLPTALITDATSKESTEPVLLPEGSFSPTPPPMSSAPNPFLEELEDN